MMLPSIRIFWIFFVGAGSSLVFGAVHRLSTIITPILLLLCIL